MKTTRRLTKRTENQERIRTARRLSRLRRENPGTAYELRPNGRGASYIRPAKVRAA